MTDDATSAFLAHLAEYGLNPGTIKWDRKIHRFPGRGKGKRNEAAFYRAFEDQRGATFGDYSQGIVEPITWQHRNGGKPDDLDPKEWAKRKRQWKKEADEREAERVRDQEAAAVACDERWKAASTTVDLDHPYLQTKRIESAPGMRQEGDLLLVPMKAFGEGNPLVNIQTIDGDGKKRFTFAAQVVGTRTTIGARAFLKDPKKVLYLCEGWATGWAVHHASKKAVVVAFNAGNLEAVATSLREEYPDANIIVCADNDRWTTTSRKGRGELPNPGLVFAQEVCERVDGVRYAIPDFLVLDDEPTDFSDLYMEEGVERVRHWLDPENAPFAITTPEGGGAVLEVDDQEDDEDEDDEPAGRASAPPLPPPTRWLDTARFRCLGYDRGVYYYLSRESGQITELSATGHQKLSLLMLEHLSWWESNFPGKQGVNWTVAADAMLRASHRCGVFRRERMRGVGCWTDKDGTIIHLGDRLLPPGSTEYVDPEQYTCADSNVFERRDRCPGPSSTPLTLDKAKELLALYTDLMWLTDASGHMLAGWSVLAPICGALTWRPHVWIVGGSGSGKSTVLERLLSPMMAGMGKYYGVGTTEPGMRQEIKADAVPVLYDEAEGGDARADARIQAVLLLARGASSLGGGATAKGTTHGAAMTFQAASMFCLASIGGALKAEADKTRVSLLQLESRSDNEERQKVRAAHWSEYEERLTATVNPDLGRDLFARTLEWLQDGRLTETILRFKVAAVQVLGDARTADQYGTLFAGAWTLMSDDVPDPMEARELLQSSDLDSFISEQQPDGMRALHVIMQRRERVDTKNGPQLVTVGQLIDVACGKLVPGVADSDADNVLKQLGMKVEIRNGDRCLLVANTSDWVSRALVDTPYSVSVKTALLGLEGVHSTGSSRFGGFVSRATAIPLRVLDKLQAEE